MQDVRDSKLKYNVQGDHVRFLCFYAVDVYESFTSKQLKEEGITSAPMSAWIILEFLYLVNFAHISFSNIHLYIGKKIQ